MRRADTTRQELARLCHSGLDVSSFFERVGSALRGTVRFDGVCWMTFDPATNLPTGHIAQDSIRPEDTPRLAHNEFLEDDVNKFAELARRRRPSGTLLDATEQDPGRSPRYRELLRPNGFEDELRVSFVEARSCWGGAALYRSPEQQPFEETEARFLAEVSPYVAEGLRRAILIAAIPTEEAVDAPGLILLDTANATEAITPAASRWLDELLVVGSRADGELPGVVHAVASRARVLARGGEDGVARARIQTPAGRWLVLHGSVLDGEAAGRAAVILEPARPPEIAPLIVEAYGLSERERDVTQLVIQGLSTNEIGATLHLSPYTVQDHLKSIFDKVGVRSRRELVAQVFFQHYAPRFGHGDNLAADGWFAASA